MQTAKLFTNGSSQAVRLPKDYRFAGDEVGVARLGELVLLYPKDSAETIFLSSLGNFTDDFFDSVEQAHAETFPDTPRESL